MEVARPLQNLFQLSVHQALIVQPADSNSALAYNYVRPRPDDSILHPDDALLDSVCDERPDVLAAVPGSLFGAVNFFVRSIL